MCVVFVAHLAVATGDEERGTALSSYDEGMKHYNLGDFRTAREKFRSAYLSVADPAFLFNIGQASRMLGDAEDAIRSYRAFLRERPESPNRSLVEKFIAQLSDELKRRGEAPAPIVLPVNAGRATSNLDGDAPAVAVPSPGAPAKIGGEGVAAPPKGGRRWLWYVLTAAGVALAGSVVGLVVAFTTRNNAPDPSSTVGVMMVQFH